ncbi:uncharacterized protein [Macrobrachium rosenbergii]|uniref:uncharacterized protein n=1 Tax=Macrobrachium rosenbergii TaxID=79674 RepID=UPI0034D47F49
MENIEDIVALITPAHKQQRDVMEAVVEYVHCMVLVEAVKAYIAIENKKKKRRPRRVWAWPYLQRRVELGHYDNLMEELATENPELYRNFTRTDRDIFSDIVEGVTPYIEKQRTFWREPLTPGLCAAITLRFLATGDSYKSLQYAFRVANNAISCIVPETCRAIVSAFGDEELQVPQTPEAWKQVARGFEERWNFPHIIGAIDGKHIRLRNPPLGGTHYYNYKKFFSMILLAIVDASYKFLYVDVGAIGSESDGGVFARTCLCEMLAKQEANLPQPEALPDATNGAPVDYFLLGNDAFPCGTIS